MKLPEAREEWTWALLRSHDIEELWDHAISPHVAASYRARMDLLCELVTGLAGPSGRVLDVGCAQGTLGLMLAERGLRVTLIDIRSQNIEYARARHEAGEVSFQVGILSDSCPPSNDYDVVICTEVLEHVQRPAEFLLQLKAKARPGGCLCLTTPNASYVLANLPSYGSARQSVIDLAEPDSLDGSAHRFLFTKEELIAMVRGVGMRIESHEFFLPAWLEGHVKTRHLHRLHYLARNVILDLSPRVPEPFGRFACSSQYLVARLPGSPAPDPKPQVSPGA